MIEKEKFIGTVSEDRFIEIEKGQLKLFAKSTGENDPIYTDEKAARAAGHPALPAPPTFAFSLNLLAPQKEGPTLLDMGVNLAMVLHGEQEFTYHKMMYAGDTMRLKTKVTDIYDKKAGKLEFIVTETTAHNQHGDLCVSQRCVIVARN